MKQTIRESFLRAIKTQIGISLIFLFLFSASSILINYVWMKDRSEQTANFIHRHISANNMREVGLALQESQNQYFESITFITSRPGGSFAFPPSLLFSIYRSFFSRMSIGKIEVQINKLGDEERFTFFYNRFKLLPYAFALWMLLLLLSIPQLIITRKRIIREYDEKIEIERELARASLAKVVRHNIRTPLSALMSLSSRIRFSTDEESQLFRDVITQIKILISDLDPSDKHDAHKTAVTGKIDDILLQAIKETRLTLPPDVRIIQEPGVSHSQSKFVPHELKTIFFNIINNSVEADAQNIRIHVAEKANELEVAITDDGMGMTSEVYAKCFQRGFTHGKKSGSGLGLSHAKNKIESWNGEVQLESTYGGGTKIILRLPIAKRPHWQVQRLEISNTDTVVVIDDQPAYHNIWKIRLSELNFSGTLRVFYDVEEALNCINTINASSLIVFADYDLGDEADKGTKIFENKMNFKFGALVTGHFEEADVISFCEENNIGLIPKTFLPDIPIAII